MFSNNNKYPGHPGRCYCPLLLARLTNPHLRTAPINNVFGWDLILERILHLPPIFRPDTSKRPPLILKEGNGFS